MCRRVVWKVSQILKDDLKIDNEKDFRIVDGFANRLSIVLKN